MELPKHVCFKGDNGLYLSARVIQGYNYLQFSSSDMGDPTVRHTIHTNRDDGTIRMKSDHFGKFWRRSPNWIWADSDDTTDDNLDTVFRAVKFGDEFALQPRQRLVLHEADHRRQEELPQRLCPKHQQVGTPTAGRGMAVLSRRIYNVVNRVMDARIHGQKVQTVATETAVNRTGTASAAKLTLKYSVEAHLDR
ncbi:hypothetical protein PVAP13_8KG118100 [Panicum virgatum]|uniref:Agglutinin domain-containing protein n=1 Tax=Panicum virgatum TaxID=38727 RepID=A0A8T0PT15_PANVG|nr:hypothetical protein PVAP13_8KG118100 [Panicum virgatum]